MIYNNWMSYLNDEAKLTETAIPGSHNAGSYGMNAMACCQDGDMYEQFKYGVRYFCVRLNTDKKGVIRLAHGLTSGVEFEAVLNDWKKMLETNDSEFFIFDVREYYPQTFGPVTFTYRADCKAVDKLLAKYISPEEYAYTDFDDIRNVTVGDMRKSGKRFILINYMAGYKGSVNCPLSSPWDKKLFGSSPEIFVPENLKYFDTDKSEGFFWFQTQLTPNFGTQLGIKTPRKLNAMMDPHFHEFTDAIAAKPEWLKKANIIACDFITENFDKSRRILALNADKGIVKPELKDEYIKGL